MPFFFLFLFLFIIIIFCARRRRQILLLVVRKVFPFAFFPFLLSSRLSFLFVSRLLLLLLLFGGTNLLCISLPSSCSFGLSERVPARRASQSVVVVVVVFFFSRTVVAQRCFVVLRDVSSIALCISSRTGGRIRPTSLRVFPQDVRDTRRTTSRSSKSSSFSWSSFSSRGDDEDAVVVERRTTSSISARFGVRKNMRRCLFEGNNYPSKSTMCVLVSCPTTKVREREETVLPMRRRRDEEEDKERTNAHNARACVCACVFTEEERERERHVHTSKSQETPDEIKHTRDQKRDYYDAPKDILLLLTRLIKDQLQSEYRRMYMNT